LPNLEHPSITQVNKTGNPNMVSQPVHFGVDALDYEILKGDKYIELPNGELLLEENIEDYLIEVLGWVYKIAD